MVFLLIVPLAWFLYVKGFRIFAYAIFFFFVTAGFQLVPEEIMKTGLGFSKGADFAIILLLGCILIDSFCIKGYLKIDKFLKLIIAFYLFILVCAIYSKFVVHCSLSEITRTTRPYFLLLTYLVFRNMKKEELENLVNIMFVFTVATSFLFILQPILGKTILMDAGISTADLFGIEVKRYYNHPFMLHFFTLMAIYKNPYRGMTKILTIFILVLALFLGFHRNLTGGFIFCLLLGYVLRMPKVRMIKTFVITSAICIPLLAFVGNKFLKSKTFVDIQLLMKGNVMDTDIDLEAIGESTFTFRMAHLWERMNYLSDSRVMQLIGAGLIPEDSKKVQQKFDFMVGLLEEVSEQPIQLETSDISYSVLFIRFGYLGTLFFLTIYFYLMVYFFKRRQNEYAFFSFLYILLSLLCSFFSGNLLMPVTYILPILSMCIIDKQIKEEHA